MPNSNDRSLKTQNQILEEQVAKNAAELDEVNKKYLNIYNEAPDMFLSVSPTDGKIFNCNKTLLAKLGYTTEEVIGQPVFNFYHPDCIENVKEVFERFQKKGYVSNAELAVKTKSGDKLPVLLSVSAVKDENGKVLYSSSVWRDNTELKAAQDELKKLNNELEDRVQQRTAELEESNARLLEFAYIASHDLKSPIRSINNLINHFLEDYAEKTNEEGKELLNKATQLTVKMNTLIQELLKFSKTTYIEDSFNKINLEDIVLECKERIEDETPNLAFSHSNLPTIFVDKVRFVEVFYNLFTNAIKYNNSKEKKIQIDFDSNTNKLHFTDNGIGIEKSNYEKVFKIFRRLHNKDEYNGGNGAGMALSKRILDRHGVEITIESQVGEGTTFILDLTPVLVN